MGQAIYDLMENNKQCSGSVKCTITEIYILYFALFRFVTGAVIVTCAV